MAERRAAVIAARRCLDQRESQQHGGIPEVLLRSAHRIGAKQLDPHLSNTLRTEPDLVLFDLPDAYRGANGVVLS